MATSWFSCKPCSESDPTQHTVKVDPKLFNKENVQPLQLAKQNADEKRQREAEEEKARTRRKEEVAAAEAAEALRVRKEVERAAAERAQREELARRQAEEVARREALQRAAAERAREEEASRAAAAAVAAAAEEERRRQEAERAEEQARLAREEAEVKVGAWCKDNGFPDMNSQKKTFRGATKFPLHTAVKHNNREIIEMMLIVGVNKDVKDSKKQSPTELAAKLNKNGSHDQIMAMLQ